MQSWNLADTKSALDENLARASAEMWGEALNFLDSFCFVYLIKEKNESPSGRTKVNRIRH